MRIGIVALLHESNTFVREFTTLENFRADLYLIGEPIRDRLSESHHEVGGFFAGLVESGGPDVEPVPLVAFRATPSGVIAEDTFEFLSTQVLESVGAADHLDGLLVAAHGAAVSARFPDADGEWLKRLRSVVGEEIPIVATLDAHANLSQQMVDSCDALVAYRTNPHLDQRHRGREAARLLLGTLRNEIRPTMAAAFPPLAINIDRQCTDEPHLRSVYHTADLQLRASDVASNSILLGFPYADVSELGAAAIVVTNDNTSRAQALANDLADALWDSREAMRGQLIGLDEAVGQCVAQTNERVCLLDMGDNVGGGSPGDGTALLEALLGRGVGPSFVCLCDPQAVRDCERIGIGGRHQLTVGGKTDDQHGRPLELNVEVVSLHDGHFTEDQPRHGGITQFDQGATAVVQSVEGAATVMLTSRRIAPFSLRQLTSCDLDPCRFRFLVAKGVNAPLAAYREVCDTFIRVNTIGSTCADLTRLSFSRRRMPLFPLEEQTDWKPTS